MNPNIIRRLTLGTRAVAAVLLLAVSASGCTKGQLQGTSSSYVIIEVLEAASGATPSQFSGTLGSDVQTLVKKTVDGKEVRVPTVFSDGARVALRLGLKDPGTPSVPLAPTSANFITLTRYHVQFIRSDGRNTPGVDVPYAFDGAATVTVGDQPTEMFFTLVRVQSKEETPLLALIQNGGASVISTIAEVTFYGSDQTGRPVSVIARISVNFADWGDPD